MTFAAKVYAIVRQIPKGQVMTYGEVAEFAGSAGAARAVGNVLCQNYDPAIPCHRVVRADGRPGGYNRGRRKKIEMLKYEGVEKLT